MPRYFFNVHDGMDVEDEEGMELPDFRAARVEAVRLAGRIIDHEADHVASVEDWRLEVTDQSGLILFQILFLMTTTPAVPGEG